MADPQKPDDRVWVAVHQHWALVRVEGRGSFKVSTSLKEFGQAALQSGTTMAVLDMGSCVGMDSTFMGVLAGLAFRFRQKKGGQVILVNVSARNRGLLATLGLDQTVQAYMTGAAPRPYKDLLAGQPELATLPGEADHHTTAETMLEAHENLVSLSPENYPKFKDVLTFLREDLNRSSDDTATGG